jgi:peptidoglycan/LPS O-acetylase OafA/YrhL
VGEWFYLLLPAALWLGLKTKARFFTVFLITVAAFYLFSTGMRVESAWEPIRSWSDRERVVVIARFDALMIGLFAAWLAQRFPELWRRHAGWLAVGGLVLSLAMYATLFRPGGGFVVNAPETFFARTFRFNLVSLGFALLLPAASGWTLVRETPGSVAVRRIAIWSYSMYLVHQPVIQLVDRHLFAGWQTSFAQAAASFGTQVGGTILISALVYRLYEAPITRLRDGAAPRVARWFRRRETLAAAVGAETAMPAPKT